MIHIVSYSGGLGSFMAAKLTIDRFGKENCKLVFTDTKTEDEDLYRFISETETYFGVEVERLQDGRNIWEVFTDVKFHGNNRIDPCSRVLKRELFRKYVESNFEPDQCTIVFGIGHNEAHRMTSIVDRWQPYKCVAPLINNWISREQIEDALDQAGIALPRLYELGFQHNNCGGFCVKTGQRQMKLLLEKLPERYRWHEQQQEELFKVIGKRHGFIRKVIDGEMRYLSLKEFREMVERGDQVEMQLESGCGCFV